MDVTIMTILATNCEDDDAVIDAPATGDHDHDVLAGSYSLTSLTAREGRLVRWPMRDDCIQRLIMMTYDDDEDDNDDDDD